LEPSSLDLESVGEGGGEGREIDAAVKAGLEFRDEGFAQDRLSAVQVPGGKGGEGDDRTGGEAASPKDCAVPFGAGSGAGGGVVRHLHLF
jgi:hypothetical protein